MFMVVDNVREHTYYYRFYTIVFALVFGLYCVIHGALKVFAKILTNIKLQLLTYLKVVFILA